MQKRLMIILVILFIICPIYSASHDFVEGKDVVKQDLHLPVSVGFSNFSEQYVGFAQKALGSFDSSVTAKATIDINKVDKEGKFKSEPFYVYWKFICSSDKVPKISLKINSPLKSATAKKGLDVHWMAVCTITKDGQSLDLIVDSLTPNNIQQIYPAPGKTLAESEVVLLKEFGSLPITLYTLTDYWTVASGVYSGDLWLVVEGK